MDLAEHFRLIWQRRWLVAVASLLVAAAVYAWSSSRANVYQGRTVVDAISGSTSGGDSLTQEEVSILTSRIAALATTTSVLSDGIERAGLPIDVETAEDRVSTSETNSPGFLVIEATGDTPREARLLVRGVTAALIAKAEEDQNPVDVVSSASVSGSPVSPRPSRDAALAFLVALVVNAELAAMIGRRAGRFDTSRLAEELRAAGAPLLAYLPRRGAQEETVEGFRELRARVEMARADAPFRTLVLVEGETTGASAFVATGLAQAIANARTNVVLVEANLRSPTISDALHLPAEPGLGNVLRGRSVDDGVLQAANPLQANYRVIAEGTGVSDPPGRLGAGALRKVFDQLMDTEVIVVDAPGIDEGIDAMVIASQCEAAIVVVDVARTRRRAVADQVQSLRDVHATVIGSVVTRGRQARPERRRANR